MSLEVYINDSLVDLPPGAVVTTNYQANNIGDAVSRQADFSNNIDADYTNNNDKIFGFARFLGSGSKIPYQKLKAKIVQNGVETLPNGSAILNSVNGKYNFTIYSGIFEPFTLLEAINLRDLDLSDFDYIWNLAGAAAIANTTEGAVYSAIQYGSLIDGDSDFDIRFQHHSVYTHTLITKMFETIGFTIEGDILTDPRYLELTVPSGTPDFFHSSIEVSSPIDLNYNITDSGIPVDFFTEDFDLLGEWNGSDVFTNGITRTQGFRVKLEIKNLTGSITVRVTSSKDNAQEIFVSPDSNGKASVNFLTDSGDYIINETVSVELISINANETCTIRAGARFINLATGPVFEDGAKIFINENLPELDCKTHLKNELQIFAITNTVNLFDGVVKFTTFNRILKNIAKSQDWTDKLDLQKTQSFSFSFGSYAQKNIASWNNDDNVPDGLGQGFFLIENETLPATSELFDISYSASNSGTFLQGVTMAIIEKYTALGVLEFESDPRLLYVKDLSQAINFVDGSGNQVVNNMKVGYFKDPDEINNLGFDNNVLVQFYSGFITMLQNFEGAKPSLLLSQRDIEGLDLTIPVYFKQYGAHFLINKIENYINGASVPVELIRIDG